MLGALALRNIHVRTQGPDRPAGVIGDNRCLGKDPAIRPVLVPKPELDLIMLLGNIASGVL